VPEPTEAAEVHQALDALLHLAPGVTLDLAGRFDRVANRLHVAFAQLVDLLGLGDLGNGAELPRSRGADAVDVRQRKCDGLAAREIDT
jgi:hypothetical protein